MDQRERLNDPQEALRVAMEGHQAKIWTSMPGILQSYNAAALTCTVQPSVQGQVRQQDGAWKDVNLPVLLDCPVIFPSGGGFALTFPLKKGDEGLIVIASRCIDSWWYSGGVQKQARARMHDLSDGFFLPGCFSKPRALSNVPADRVQLRNDDRSIMVELGTQELVLKHPIKISLDAPLTEMSGTFSALNRGGTGTTGVIEGGIHTTGQVTSDTDVVGGGISVKNHKHGGVQTGNGQTGGPI